MGTDITVKHSAINRATGEMSGAYVGVYRQVDAVRAAAKVLAGMPSFDDVAVIVDKYADELAISSRDMKTLSIVLDHILNQYINTEKSIVSSSGNMKLDIGDFDSIMGNDFNTWFTNMMLLMFPWITAPIWAIFNSTDSVIGWIRDWYNSRKDKNVRYKVDSIVFDHKGAYGGDQGSPKSIKDRARKEEMFKLIEKNIGRHLSDREKDAYFKRLNSEGCGYVAIVNTIFVEYADKPAEFEKTFGYPMYHNGDLNYDMLIADMYSTMDNTDGSGKFDPYNDYDVDSDGNKGSYNAWTDKSGNGTYPSEQAKFITNFMKDHGVDVSSTVTNNVTVDNFEQLSREGKQVVVDFYHGDLLNMNGTVAQTINGGHAMTVTGVTKDGKFIVSSWGKEYMIDPKGTNAKTYMTFVTVDYN